MNYKFQDISEQILSYAQPTDIIAPKRFQLGTWNLLAPCWKRLKEGRESEEKYLWETRQQASLQYLKAALWDVMFLQEVWFHKDYVKILVAEFTSTYHIYFLQRVHRKEDGLCILLRKSVFPTPVELIGIDFNDFGSRIALLLIWDEYVMLNTHLTFPHSNQYDNILRMNQVKKIITILQDFPNRGKVLAGDFNGSIYDPAVRVLLDEGGLHPMLNHADFLTHHSHRGDDMACDLILSSADVSIDEVAIDHLYPHLSDHALVQASIQVL